MTLYLTFFDTVFLNDALVSHDFVYFANAVPCVNVLVAPHTCDGRAVMSSLECVFLAAVTGERYFADGAFFRCYSIDDYLIHQM